ncbi:DUF6169 family protein [Plebeiibacterium sediminum]|uniref:DUF6169 family protein n=1 Tax=Plebeiibacterium sediminum TaxID=2992112 RepID=A0AAE3M0L1_9BACT|nr:DUF6169 family protein [Plebeiobacterium sediminum]MCW3784931.1 DUF6169 family protein [Plebeiobacterium sediminum]
MLRPYNYINLGDYYTFTTDNDLEYTVTFKDLSDNLNTHGKYQVVDFSFFCVNKPIKMKHDPKVSITLLDLVYNFFTKNEYVLLFVCDVSDGKGRCRKITFNKWINQTGLIKNIASKHDSSFMELGVDYCSLIVSNSHPMREEIIDDFYKGDLFYISDK